MAIPKSLLIIIAIVARALGSEAPSAYEMLERFNFPRGILPEGVRGYTLGEDGAFEVYLSGECEFKVEEGRGGGGGYLLRYKERIAGRVASGSLRELSGVSVRVLLVWFGIGEVVRSDADLDFYVGPLSASFPVSNFEESPRCGCGFYCAPPSSSSSSSAAAAAAEA
ncbi:hypothetical protein ACMD2_25759 [Ananas comosus]|uniref:Uncharacterized protein n=1 Tax=Ananas comosus TaxID=4615 RepID=A0A199UTQ5_ANACO|nr:hypothetical protein ACMD2_25759 [Ananas comosus]